LLPDWLGSYQKDWLRPDIIAGLTTAAVVIPKAMAYATIAGLPVQVGLYTAFIPLVIYAFCGTSRVLSVSTTTTIAILTAAELSNVVPNDADPKALITATATLAVLVGTALILASILRLGFVASFISEPVLIGFKAGIGLVIILDQVPKILGVHFPKGRFLHNQMALLHSLPDTKLITLVVGIGVIVLLLGIKRYLPKAPAPLIAVGIAIIAAYVWNLHDRGVELVGHIPQGLPSFLRPDVSLAAQLWPGAVGIALMSFTETIASGRAFSRSDEPSPKPNRELLATGLANIVGALFGAMPGGGGTSQTAVNRSAGACSQVSELVTASITLVTMLFLAPVLALMPQATLAGVVIVYSIGLIKPAEFREILRVRRTEFVWAVVALTGVVVVGTLKGILVAIIVSLVALAYQVADPPIHMLGRKPGTNVFRPRSEEHPEDETIPGLLMLRVEGRIFFANAEHIARKIKLIAEAEQPTVLALDLSAILDIEYTALKMLIEEERHQRELGKQIWLVGMNPRVLQVVQNSKLAQRFGREAIHFNLETVIATYLGIAAEAAGQAQS
jgi:high affinity sulfate transporter 1